MIPDKGEGPYSRRLYGPPPPPEIMASPIAKIDEERRKRTRSHEQLLFSEVGSFLILFTMNLTY